ncbi:hypothetical protein [Luteibacter sp. 9135]|uniref:hypothetical protein n=1 Tax=Luteibacter sp. 9135 TaxID=1500893 RepID=UPI001C83995A|nr:hypothetical protein [Luteibacter sp. 9135]
MAVYAIFQTALASNEGARSASEARELNARTTTLLEGINQSLPEIRTGVADIKAQVSSGAYSQSAAAQAEPDGSAKTGDEADALIRASSPMGLVAVQAAILSFQNNKYIPFSSFDTDTMWHTLGVISGLSSAKWMEFAVSEVNTIYSVIVKEVNPALLARYSEVLDRIQQQPAQSLSVVQSNALAKFFSTSIWDDPAPSSL